MGRSRAKEPRVKERVFDAAEFLRTEAQMIAYLEAAMEDGDAGLIAATIGDIARARGMTTVAKETGLGRESLYKTLSADGNPEVTTVLKVLKSLGLGMRVKRLRTSGR